MKLILASSSAARQRLLHQLGLPFECRSPDIDETPLDGEDIDAYVARLALAKARAVADDIPGAWIIGSDQACSIGGEIMRKPSSTTEAENQLRLFSGMWLQFHTGVALLTSGSGGHQVHVEPFAVHFRELSDEEIKAYVQRDRPLDCAGCFKVESAGITLFHDMRGSDYNSLIGLPLIALVDMLRHAGINPLLAAPSAESGGPP